MTDQDHVDNEARVDIALLHQKVEHLSENLKKHMGYEEKQRDKFEVVVNGLGERVSTLSRVVWIAMGAVGGIQILDYIPV